jgi:hypothetical protein
MAKGRSSEEALRDCNRWRAARDVRNPDHESRISTRESGFALARCAFARSGAQRLRDYKDLCRRGRCLRSPFDIQTRGGPSTREMPGNAMECKEMR